MNENTIAPIRIRIIEGKPTVGKMAQALFALIKRRLVTPFDDVNEEYQNTLNQPIGEVSKITITREGIFAEVITYETDVLQVLADEYVSVDNVGSPDSQTL